MTCNEIRKLIHDYMDGELPANQAVLFEQHLESCPYCSENWQDLEWTKQLLNVKDRLSAEEHVWAQIRRKTRLEPWAWLFERWDSCRTYWRDMDRSAFWSKISAVPVTLLFFTTILMQFHLQGVEEWTYPAITVRRLPSSVITESSLTEVQVRYTYAELDGIITTAWKMPYEDSFSLLAQVMPEGHAEISRVLEYPKSPNLLEAVDVTLRSSEFEVARNLSKPLLLYSFQKIDVYAEYPHF